MGFSESKLKVHLEVYDTSNSGEAKTFTLTGVLSPDLIAFNFPTWPRVGSYMEQGRQLKGDG